MGHRHLHRKGVPYYELYQSQLTIKDLTTRDSGKGPFDNSFDYTRTKAIIHDPTRYK